MLKDIEDTQALLDKFIDNGVKPATHILQKIWLVLNACRKKIQQLEAELAAKPKPEPKQTMTQIAQNRLVTEMWAKFPPIPGSNYHRVYCARCMEPMRASKEACADIMAGDLVLFCEKCDPPILLPKAWHLTPRQRQKLDKTSS